MLYTHGQVFVSSKFQRPVFTVIDSSLIQRQQLYLPSHGWAQVTSTNYPQSFYVLSLVMWQLFRKHPSCTGSKPCMHAWMHWYCTVQFHAVRTCSQTKCIPTAADLYWEISRLHASWCIALVAMELFDCSLKAAEHGLRSGETSGSWDVLGIPALASEWFVEDVAATNWIDCQESGKVTVTRCCFRVEFWKKASLSHVLDPLSLQWCNGLSMSMCMKEG